MPVDAAATVTATREEVWCFFIDVLKAWHDDGLEWDAIVAMTSLAMRGQSTRREAGVLMSIADLEGWPAVLHMIAVAMR